MAGTNKTDDVTAEAMHIKSRERVRDLGEVYTQPREVQAMLDLIPDTFKEVDTRFLEPAAGNGNFLVAILERKIALVTNDASLNTRETFEFALLRCLASLYAIDINDENVNEARARLLPLVLEAAMSKSSSLSAGFEEAVREVLRTNVVVGDSLNAADQILFIEYTALPGERFQRVRSELEPPEADLFYMPPDPLPTVHYLELGQ